MYHTTGFTKAEITELCARIEARELSPGMRRWPPVLGLRNALTVTLTYLRRNRVQAEIAENYGVSQPTISRAISAITPLLVQALLDYVPTTDELDAGTCYIVDGTMLPCWSWRAHPELYSAGHCELQNLADHAHRLPPSPGNIPRNHLSRSRPALLRNRLNNPPGLLESNNIPVSPSVTDSGTPPPPLATIIRPLAIASSGTRPKGSSNSEGYTTRSDSAYRQGISDELMPLTSLEVAMSARAAVRAAA